MGKRPDLRAEKDGDGAPAGETPVGEAKEGNPGRGATGGGPEEEGRVHEPEQGRPAQEAEDGSLVEEAREEAPTEGVREGGQDGQPQGRRPTEFPEGDAMSTTDLVREPPPAEPHQVASEHPKVLEPGSATISEAMRRHWFLVAMTAILLAAAGVGYGLYRKPSYTAEARLTVARFAVPNADLSGFVQAAQGLTVAYASGINSDQVVRSVSDKLHVTPDQVRSDLSATPLPSTPVLRVLGASRDRQTAINLANAGSTALVKYAASLNLVNPDTARLLSEYHNAAMAVAQADAAQHRAQVAYGNRKNAHNKRMLLAANAAQSTAMVQEEALSGAYQSSQAGQGSASALELVTRANSASSDRSSKMQIAGFAGLVLGLIVGGAFALALTKRRVVLAAQT